VGSQLRRLTSSPRDSSPHRSIQASSRQRWSLPRCWRTPRLRTTSASHGAGEADWIVETQLERSPS
jgi:hypothetical protein